MWPGPPGLTGGLGVSAQRPVGEEDLTDTGHVQPDQHVREKGGRQNGATPTPAQVFIMVHIAYHIGSWFEKMHSIFSTLMSYVLTPKGSHRSKNTVFL